MAKCVHCGKSGLFLRLDKRGLCNDCAQERLTELYKAANYIDGNTLVLNTPKQLSETEVMKMVFESINNSLRILADSANIIEKTANPETFYSRRNLLYKHIDHLMRFEQIDPLLFKNSQPSEITQKMYRELEQGEAEIWERCYNAALEKANKMKTEKGRMNVINKYFDMAREYEGNLGENAKSIIQQQKSRHLKALNE